LVQTPTNVSTVTMDALTKGAEASAGSSEDGSADESEPPAASSRLRSWWRDTIRTLRGWSGRRKVLLGLAEAVLSIGTAIGFMLWGITIDVDPMSRRGQVSGLAQLQFRLAICVLVLVVVLVVAQRLLRGRHREVLVALGCSTVAGLATGLVGAGIAVALRGTPYGLWAADGDYSRILYWVDQMLHGQPAPDFYPPLYLDLLRWGSIWTGQPPVYLVKGLQLAGTALFGPAAYLCWRLVLRPGWALGIGLVAAFPFIEPVKPYTQVTLVMMVPVLIALFRRVRRADETTWVRAVWAGVRYGAALGVLFLLYTGWFVWVAPGAVVAFALLVPWRRAAGRASLIAGSAVVVFVAIAWPHLRGLLNPTGAVADNFFYFDTDTDPSYFAMWRNDRPGDIAGSLWPPPAEWSGVGLFTIALAVGLAVALWLGWRRTPVVVVGLFAASAWFLRMYLAGQAFATGTVRLYPRTTMVLLYCTLILAGFAVKYAFEIAAARVRRLATTDPGTDVVPRFTPAGIPVGLALIPVVFLFASGGSNWVDRYLPGKADTYGGYATEAQNTPQLDGHCPRYATQCTPTRPG
jgi:galactan 5-O-arabinofuranosyltransferase